MQLLSSNAKMANDGIDAFTGLRNLRPCRASQVCILAIEARPIPLISESSRLVCRDMISGRKTVRSESPRTTNDAYRAFVIN